MANQTGVRSSRIVLALVGVVMVFGAHLWCSRTRLPLALLTW